MTLLEIHNRFKILYDKIDSYALPEVTPEQTDIFLNMAQEQFIDTIAVAGIEKNATISDFLKNIINPYSTNTFIIDSTNKPNSVYVTLPSDYRRALLEEVDITYTCNNISTISRVPVVPITRDRYLKVIDNPFDKPWEKEIKRLSSNVKSGLQTFELVGAAGITITNYYMDYLRNPSPIQYGTQYAVPVADINCELSDSAQKEIIKMAAALAEEVLVGSKQNTAPQSN